MPTLLAILFIVREVGIGLLLAMTLGFLLIPAKIAGAYVGQEIGLSLASISDPGPSDQSTLVTKIFETLAVLLFFGLNLHHFLILFLHISMTHLANKISLLDLPTEGLIRLVDDMPEYGLLILAPLGIVMFLLNSRPCFFEQGSSDVESLFRGHVAAQWTGDCLLDFFHARDRSGDGHVLYAGDGSAGTNDGILGKWKVESGKWKVESGKWKVAWLSSSRNQRGTFNIQPGIFQLPGIFNYQDYSVNVLTPIEGISNASLEFRRPKLFRFFPANNHLLTNTTFSFDVRKRTNTRSENRRANATAVGKSTRGRPDGIQLRVVGWTDGFGRDVFLPVGRKMVF